MTNDTAIAGAHDAVHTTGFTRLEGRAAPQGWRMPAEWEPLEAVWLVRPHNEETWPLALAGAQAEWDAWRRALEEVVRVRTTDELGIATIFHNPSGCGGLTLSPYRVVLSNPEIESN